jgi:hypothetical protein
MDKEAAASLAAEGLKLVQKIVANVRNHSFVHDHEFASGQLAFEKARIGSRYSSWALLALSCHPFALLNNTWDFDLLRRQHPCIVRLYGMVW